MWSALAREADALHRATGDLDRRKPRLVRKLEEQDDPEGMLFRAVRDRLNEIGAEREQKLARLNAAGGSFDRHEDAVELLDALDDDMTLDDLRAAPDALLRPLFDAFRLRVVYDGRTGRPPVGRR